MKLYEIIEYINDNTIVELWNQNQEIISIYDGKESIPEDYEEYEVNDIFADLYTHNNCTIPSIGIEITTEE